MATDAFTLIDLAQGSQPQTGKPPVGFGPAVDAAPSADDQTVTRPGAFHTTWQDEHGKVPIKSSLTRQEFNEILGQAEALKRAGKLSPDFLSDGSAD